MPTYTEKDLKDFQVEDRDFLLARSHLASRGAYLATAPGTGKTVTVCSAIAKGNLQKVLIVCPANLRIKNAWKWHLIHWAGFAPDNIQVIMSRSDQVRANVQGKSAIIVNYELLIKDSDVYRCIYWDKYDVIVVDEAKRLRNMDSQTSESLLGRGGDCLISRGYYKWLLDGTPAPNRLIELYPPLKTLALELIKPYDSFGKYGLRYCAGFRDADGWNFKGSSNEQELHERIKSFMRIRRLQDVWDEIPDVIERNVYLDIGTIHDPETGEIIDASNSYMSTVRKAVGACKIPYVIDYVRQVASEEPDRQAVIFTYSQAVSEALSDRLGIPAIYGDIDHRQREHALSKFTARECQYLVAQIGTAGQGLNGLQDVCDYMIIVEPDWAPGGHDQIIGRLVRYGQTSDIVRVDNIIAVGTLDEQVVGSRWNKAKSLAKVIKPNYVIEENEMTIEAKLDQVIGLLQQIAANQGSEPPKANGRGGKKQAQEALIPEQQPQAPVATQPTPAPIPAPAPVAAQAPIPVTNPVVMPPAPNTLPVLQPGAAAPLNQPTWDDVVASALGALNCLGQEGITEQRKAEMNAITRSFGVNEVDPGLKNAPQFWAAAVQQYDAYKARSLAQQQQAQQQPAQLAGV